ncbi:MAG TPA: nucleotide sugar dehydrogenase [Gammaproteobacteria bacterium]|nr:nucleotide sugar dehydrogenase [Gammaproteobacteria bacterium]
MKDTHFNKDDSVLKKNLIDKLNKRQALIAIIGLGYVGLPLAIRFSEVGFSVLGVDRDLEKIAKLKKGETYIDHIDQNKIKNALASGFFATPNFQELSKADAIILCLPTPLSKQREPDLSYVLNTVEAMLPFIHAGQVISLESTTYPGTTDEELKPRLESTGLQVGSELFLVYSPEREDPGNAEFSTSNIPRICGGLTPDCLEVGLALYQQITTVFPVSSTRTAEMTKLLENIHRAVNIGLVNEIKMLTDKMGIDIYEVIHAAASKPFGFVPYYPGPGIGGHCIPIDPFYLTWKAHEYGIHTRFIELAGEINSAMPQWVVHKVVDALNNQGKAIKNSKVLVLGVTYKKNVGDARESPAVTVMEHLVKKNAIVNYSDPHLPQFPKMREHFFDLKSLALTENNLAEQDAVVITTAHDLFDFNFIKTHAKLIIDTRGVYQTTDPKVVKA